MKTQKGDGHRQAMESGLKQSPPSELSEETNSADTLILDIWSAEP